MVGSRCNHGIQAERGATWPPGALLSAAIRIAAAVIVLLGEVALVAAVRAVERAQVSDEAAQHLIRCRAIRGA
jgi:hypothetical protein